MRRSSGLAAVLAGLVLGAPSPVVADTTEEILEAAIHGDATAVQAALRSGASADALGERQATALMFAAERAHVPVMQALLAAGADANARRADDITPLMHAAASGQAEPVRVLLAAGAHPNARSAQGVTPLRVAVAVGASDAARLLLAAGADRDDEDANGSRLLFTAAGNGSTELIDLFLTPGENVNHKRRAGGYTALDAALERQHWSAAHHLLKSGATLAASVTGRRDAVLKLLELEPVVDPGRNLLVQTTAMPEIELFHAVLAQGASTDFKDEAGNTLLLLAARRHHVTGLQALLAAGADVHARNADGDTALSIVAGKSEYELMVVGLGLALGQDRDSLMRLVFRPAQKSHESAATARRLQAAALLLAATADPNSADGAGNTPLIEATRTGDAELVQLLIGAGARVDAVNGSGNAPLLVAAQFGLEEICDELLAAHADVTMRDAEGRSPLELARLGKHERVVRLLERAAPTTATP